MKVNLLTTEMMELLLQHCDTHCAHLTSEGHLEEIGYGCTGHHKLYGVNSWYGELLHVSDHCSWVDELCVPMDASFRALFNQWRAVYGDVHSFIHPYVITNGDRDLT